MEVERKVACGNCAASKNSGVRRCVVSRFVSVWMDAISTDMDTDVFSTFTGSAASGSRVTANVPNRPWWSMMVLPPVNVMVLRAVSMRVRVPEKGTEAPDEEAPCSAVPGVVPSVAPEEHPARRRKARRAVERRCVGFIIGMGGQRPHDRRTLPRVQSVLFPRRSGATTRHRYLLLLLPERGVDRVFLARAQNRQAHRVARRVLLDLPREGNPDVKLRPVDRANDVSLPQARLLCRGAGEHGGFVRRFPAHDQDPVFLGDIVLLPEFFGDRRVPDAEVRLHDPAVPFVALDRAPEVRCRDGEPDILRACRDGRVHADHPAREVEERSAGVPVVDGGVGLDDALEGFRAPAEGGTGGDGALQARDDAPADGVAELAERVADGGHGLPERRLVLP